MKTVADHLATNSQGGQIAINGFSWVGDLGSGPGVGYANGFVQNNSDSLGNNMVGGGQQAYGTAAGNKLVLAQVTGGAARWKEAVVAPVFVYNVIPFMFIVSSSTNVMKAGVCSTDSDASRWSALGTTPAGRLIFASSTSTSSTTAAELCSVFKSLGADYAMRLDGSTATGMVVDGTLVNPIRGTMSALYGSARHVAYAIKVDSRIVLAGPTPVINADPPVKTPTNPCLKDRSKCL